MLITQYSLTKVPQKQHVQNGTFDCIADVIRPEKEYEYKGWRGRNWLQLLNPGGLGLCAFQLTSVSFSPTVEVGQ